MTDREALAPIWTFLEILKERWWVIATSALAATLLAFAIHSIRAPNYQATATVTIQDDPLIFQTDLAFSKITDPGAITTETTALLRSGLLTSVARDVGVAPSVVQESTTAVPLGLQAMQVTVRGPQEAEVILRRILSRYRRDRGARLVRAVSLRTSQLRSQLRAAEEAGQRAELRRATIERELLVLRVLRRTRPTGVQVGPVASSEPNLTRTLLIGLVLGTLIGGGTVLLFSLLDSRVRRRQEIERDLDAKIVGELRGADPTELDQPLAKLGAQELESLRNAAARTWHAARNGAHRVVLLARAGDDGSAPDLGVRLAAGLAVFGLRVAFVDADLHRRNASRLDGSRSGLTDLISGRRTFDEVAIEPDISGGPDGAGGHLLVVPPGESQVGPPQLDTYARLQQLLAKLGSEHDLVIVDCAPLLAGVYALPLYAQADAALVVVRLRDTSRDDLGATANELLANDIPVLGVVLESA